MICFIRNTATLAIRIGYSKTPKKRLAALQKESQEALELLGSVPGGLEVKAAYHDEFAQNQLTGEWFNGAIFSSVVAIIRAPHETMMNVILTGDSDVHQRDAVFKALDEQHAETPIGWIITGGERPLDSWAWRWASEHKVRVHRYYPEWSKYGKFAPFKVGPRMLRSQFDPKLLLVLHGHRTNPSTTDLMKKAAKRKIAVVEKSGVIQLVSVASEPEMATV